MSLPKRNSADGRCYWMKPEVQEELQPLFESRGLIPSGRR